MTFTLTFVATVSVECCFWTVMETLSTWRQTPAVITTDWVISLGPSVISNRVRLLTCCIITADRLNSTLVLQQ